MKLYYAPGACSLAPHVVLREIGRPFELVKVDLATKVAATGEALGEINPKAMVPTLVLENGERLTEGPAIGQYLADSAPELGLLPAVGDFARYRVLEWLNYLTAEIHKGFSPLFAASTPDVYKAVARRLLVPKLRYLDSAMTGREFLAGDTFSIADPYLFTLLGWATFLRFDFSPIANLAAFRERLAERPSVRAARIAEGLISAD